MFLRLELFSLAVYVSVVPALLVLFFFAIVVGCANVFLIHIGTAIIVVVPSNLTNFKF